jgi:hypothetical protein
MICRKRSVAVDHLERRQRALQQEDSRPFLPNPGPLGHQRPPQVVIVADALAQRCAVIDRHVVQQAGGMRARGGIRTVVQDGLQVFKARVSGA